MGIVCDGSVEFREISHRGEAPRRRAETEEIIAADSCDRRSDQGAGNSLQKSSEVQEERNNLRLKLSVVSGIKMMYHHYSSSKREEINKLRTQLFGDDYQLGNNRNEQM